MLIVPFTAGNQLNLLSPTSHNEEKLSDEHFNSLDEAAEEQLLSNASLQSGAIHWSSPSGSSSETLAAAEERAVILKSSLSTATSFCAV